MNETVLKTLFDYQRFEKESSLQKVIDEVLSRYNTLGDMIFLEDDSLDMVAGGIGEIPEDTDDDGQGTV